MRTLDYHLLIHLPLVVSLRIKLLVIDSYTIKRTPDSEAERQRGRVHALVSNSLVVHTVFQCRDQCYDSSIKQTSIMIEAIQVDNDAPGKLLDAGITTHIELFHVE
jgi:hypothetical protein